MDVREIPFLLFREFCVNESTGDDKRYAHVGMTAEGFPLRVQACERTSHLTLWNHHADPESDSPLFSINAGPSMSGSWRADRGEQYREGLWSTQNSIIGHRLDLPFVPIVGRMTIRAHELIVSGAFELTVTWSSERGRKS